MIRLASKEDLAVLKKVRLGVEGNKIRERLRRQRMGEVEYLVLEDEGKMVSFVVLDWKGKDSHPEYPNIVDLYTKNGERGKGYGRKLLTECEKRAKEAGFTKIGLAVNPDTNCPAKKLYERLGYKHEGGKAYLTGVDDGVENWVIDMEKEL